MVQRTTRRTRRIYRRIAIALRNRFAAAEPWEGFLQNRSLARKRDVAPDGPSEGPALRIALYQPDIALNVGAILRLGACLGVPVDVIEPCGFAFSPNAWRRSAMDYADLARIERHDSWDRFRVTRAGDRLIALTAQGAQPLWDFTFRPGDTLILGRESAGLPQEVHKAATERIVIPMQPGARSLNVGMAAAIAVAEALRQLGSAPADQHDPVGIDPA